MKLTSIYTRTGDKGTTALVGGKRVAKTHPRIEAYGTVDELSSCLGLLVAFMNDGDDKTYIEGVQNQLFRISTSLACDDDHLDIQKAYDAPAEAIAEMERKIDEINPTLPEAQSFILPGGTKAAAQCHVCRAVCRRTERRMIELAETSQVQENCLRYVNRLSDYLFVLARKLNFVAGEEEKLWKNTCK